VSRGDRLARQLLLDLNELGMPCASEILDPIMPQYVGDLLAWGSIGARTSESQTHRQLASGLSMPVGFKNTTDGRLDAACNAMVAAGRPHSFLGITHDGQAAVVRTRGNPDRHLVLRGGAEGTNYGALDVARAAARVADQGVTRPVMVDCAHGNSDKDPARQHLICSEILGRAASGEPPLLGVLLESNLHAGAQTWSEGAPLRPGVSITDPCMGWEETRQVLSEAAEKRARIA
jgi:3-deoxy-7-phosphoheptulonate synthase